MNTRLLGAAVLIALAVLLVPMFFSGKPPAPGDQTVNLAIPQAPDRELQTRTMSLNPDGASIAPDGTSVQPAAPAAPGASSDRLATVNIGSNRPRDVETDPLANQPPQPTTVTVDPGVMAAVLSAEPTPVVTAQPIKANWSSGRSVCTATNEPSGEVIMSANPPSDANAVSVCPSARRARGVSVRLNVSSQRCDWPRTQ